MAGSRFNTEFDSRVLRVSIGPGGRIAPTITPTHGLQRTYCLSCGNPWGYVSDIPPALRGDPGVFVVCSPCEARVGPPPAHAIHFTRV